jgi:hypothetical protein
MTQTYVSPSNTFSFEYPDDWKLERESGGTIQLCKKGGLFKKVSQNILRITPMLSDEIISPQAYTAILNYRKKEHKDLEVIDKSDSFTMNFHVMKYRKEEYQDLEDRTYLMIQDFWELVISNRIFTCSFSVRKDDEQTSKTQEEKEIAEKILYSLKLL